MKRRMTHFLAIEGGKISVRYAGDREEAAPHLYDDESEAIAALADKIMVIRGARMLTSSSVNWPAEEGRPDFNIDKFMVDLGTAVRKLQAA